MLSTTTQPYRNYYVGPAFEDAKVHDVMRVGTVSCRPETSLNDVARIMVGYQIHSLLVEGARFDEGESDWGIITDLEVVEAAASGSQLNAGDLAVPHLPTVAADEPLASAAKLMAERRCTHLLAVQPATGTPVGVISALGIASVIATEPRQAGAEVFQVCIRGELYAIDLDYCKGGGICVKECPCGAIEMVPETIWARQVPPVPPETETRLLERERLDDLLLALVARGYRLLGPTVRDGAIVYDEIGSSADLPEGMTDDQEGGTYRLRERPDRGLFGFAVGPRSWKSYLWPSRVRLWRASAGGDGFEVSEEEVEAPKDAYIGVRSCDLHAIASLDSAVLDVPHPDPGYAARRANVFIVALNCWQAGGTCFCVSMGTGPRATAGFDVALTEVLEDGRHYFLVEAGSESGAEVVAGLPARDASADEREAGERAVELAVAGQGRAMDTTDLKGLLYRNYEHVRWDDVADRCLTCGNCTMVCPTCFCTSVEDVTDLTGTETERVREWDSCFTLDFSYVHGGSVRNTPRSRYRQWMTHQLATWGDQFDTFGCVGCGRCITWCPVAIDITEEVAAIRATDGGGPEAWQEGTR